MEDDEILNALEKFKGKIVTLKMVGGDEVICQLEEFVSMNVIRVSNPKVFMFGNAGPGLAPYILSMQNSSTIDISLTYVIVFGQTDESLANQYRSMTTGLHLPANGLILPQ